MKEQILILYQELLRELYTRNGAGLEEVDHVEDCFRISVQYWEKAKEAMRDYRFLSGGEETSFFKEIKPLFTHQIEYYMQVYQAILFLPRDKREDQFLFWDRELGKMERFGVTHATFMGYYLTGSTDRDTEYFVRVSQEEGYWTGAKFYDLDARTCSSHDHLVAMIFAFNKYREFVQSELAKLQNHSL